MKRSKKGGGRGTDEHRMRLEFYNNHYACFSCRKMFNEPPRSRRYDGKGGMLDVMTCPECKSQMHSMGMEFKPPRRNNVRQWRKVEMLYQRGYRWRTKFETVWTTQGSMKVGYTVPVSRSPRARTLRDAKTDYPPQA